MIRPSSAKRQVLRLAGLPFYAIRQTEIMAAYEGAFDSDMDAEDFTGEWLQTGKECPIPSDIWGFARALRESRRKSSWDAPKCPLCKDAKWIPSDDPGGGFIGFAHRCSCNPETPENTGGFKPGKKAEPRGRHPEVALNIPFMVITAKTYAGKAMAAASLSYRGPLTLADAVKAGVVSRENAIGMVKYWQQEGAGLEEARKMLEDVTVRIPAPVST